MSIEPSSPFEIAEKPRERPARLSKGRSRSRHDDLDSALGQYIPLHYHGQMLTQEARVGAFRESIAKLVPQGGTVVELGGGTGIMSFFAAKNARKVYCVEQIPHVAATARRFLAANGVADRVSVVVADAMQYLPDEPVDVVICEMLHSALLREKQVLVLESFKTRYRAKFGGPLPTFIPEATILGAQLVNFPYDFQGYTAPVPMFRDPLASGDPTVALASPEIYAMFEYAGDVPSEFNYDGSHEALGEGTVNAVRFITKNAVAILPRECRSIDWHMHYLMMPLPAPVDVRAGDRVSLRFAYEAGGSILSLMESLTARRV